MSTPDPTNYYTTEAPPVRRRRGSRLRHFGVVRKPSIRTKGSRRQRTSHKGRGL